MPTLHAYARRLERELSRLDDTPVVLSPREWNHVSEWHERGIPLELILEALQQHMENRSKRKTGRPRLGALRETVNEAWEVVRDSRSVSSEAWED